MQDAKKIIFPIYGCKLLGAHKLYYKMGFMDKEAPLSMNVLERTEKIMMLQLNDDNL